MGVWCGANDRDRELNGGSLEMRKAFRWIRQNDRALSGAKMKQADYNCHIIIVIVYNCKITLAIIINCKGMQRRKVMSWKRTVIWIGMLANTWKGEADRDRKGKYNARPDRMQFIAYFNQWSAVPLFLNMVRSFVRLLISHDWRSKQGDDRPERGGVVYAI